MDSIDWDHCRRHLRKADERSLIESDESFTDWTCCLAIRFNIRTLGSGRRAWKSGRVASQFRTSKPSSRGIFRSSNNKMGIGYLVRSPEEGLMVR